MLRVQLLDPFENAERRPDRSFGVVTVRDRGAEHRHDGVADVLLDRTAVGLDRELVSA